MFYDCSSLKEMDISNFIINENNNNQKMFFGCSDELKQKIKTQNKKKRFMKKNIFLIKKFLYE